MSLCLFVYFISHLSLSLFVYFKKSCISVSLSISLVSSLSLFLSLSISIVMSLGLFVSTINHVSLFFSYRKHIYTFLASFLSLSPLISLPFTSSLTFPQGTLDIYALPFFCFLSSLSVFLSRSFYVYVSLSSILFRKI
jgi:hypothetical protein